MNDKKSGKSVLLNIFNNFEIYIGTVLFIIIMFLLFLQVVTRFVFKYSFTWTEELSIAMFVAMVYCGVSGAVTHRKHLRIDAFINAMPFKVKKALLIFSNIIFMAFNVYISYLFIDIIEKLRKSSTSLLHIPKKLLYAIVPVMLLLTTTRLIADIMKLIKETPKTLGASKPAIDIEALEEEARLLAASTEAKKADKSSEKDDKEADK